MRVLPAVDPQLWQSSTFEGRNLGDYLAVRDVGTILRFLSSRGWSRSTLAAATGLSETRVRAVAKGKQIVSSYDVLIRIADGLAIPRGLMGLASTEDPPHASRSTSVDHQFATSYSGTLNEHDSPGRIEPDVLMDGVRVVASNYLTDDAIAVYTRASGFAGRVFVQIRSSAMPDQADTRGAGYLYGMLGWTESVKIIETRSFQLFCVTVSSVGRLIQAVGGRAGGCGGRWNRSGWRACAACRTSARCWRTSVAVP